MQTETLLAENSVKLTNYAFLVANLAHLVTRIIKLKIYFFAAKEARYKKCHLYFNIIIYYLPPVHIEGKKKSNFSPKGELRNLKPKVQKGKTDQLSKKLNLDKNELPHLQIKSIIRISNK